MNTETDESVEIELETAETEVEAEAPETEDKVEKPESDELEQYSASVQKRIANLTKRYREEERQREEAARFAQQVYQENQQLKQRMQQLDSGYLTEYGQRVETQIAAAKRQYKEAYEAGDTDAMIAAQEILATATADKQRYDAARSKVETSRQSYAQQQLELARQQHAQQLAAQQQPRQQQPQPDPKAQDWAAKNEWFGQDETMTYAVFGIHRRLVEEEGFDPSSDEYYSEVDRRMRKEFPHKFRGQNSGKAQVAPAASSASRNPKQGRKAVKLTPSQIAMAKRLNVPLEEYAKFVKE